MADITPASRSSATSHADLYRNFPIPKQTRCIRILTIQTSTEGDNARLRGDLSIVDLDDNRRPDFAALSYVWGPRNPDPHTILVAEHEIHVTDSAYFFLIHLRRKARTAFRIWIDRVCINQSDLVEKSQQLPLMGDIYIQANIVYVWLGNSTDATDRAMKYLRTTGFRAYFFNTVASVAHSPHSRAQIWSAFWSASTARWRIRTQPLLRRNKDQMRMRKRLFISNFISHLLQGFGISVASTASYGDLNELLSAPWITRIWTYQEIMLSTNPVMVCGDEHIPWPTFASSIIFTNHITINSSELGTRLSTWKKVALIKEHINAIGQDSRVEESGLRRYEAYVDDITNTYRLARQWKVCIYATCFFFVAAFIAVIAFFVVTNRDSTSPPRNSTVSLSPGEATGILTAAFASATACAEACKLQVKQNQKACVKSCFTPNSTVIAASASIPRPHYDYRTALPLLLIPLCLWAVLLVNWYMARNLPFATINAALRQEEMRENDYDDLVNGICTRRVTNPKDMAFGFRSVLSKLLRVQLQRPDYNASLAQVYKDFTIDLLRATQSLRILIPASVHRLHDGSNSPTWVPDWHRGIAQFWLTPYMSFQELKSATPQSRPIWRLEDHQNMLVLRGRLIGTVATVSNFQVTAQKYVNSERDAHLANIQILLSLSRRPEDMSPELHDLLRNPLNHPDLTKDIGLQDLIRYADAIMYSNGKSSEEVLARFLEDESKMNPVSSGNSGEFEDGTRISLLDTHIGICKSMLHTSRKVFWTKDLQLVSLFVCAHEDIPRYGNLARYDAPLGKFDSWGVCTNDVSAGDRIALVSGVPVPLVIRPIHSSAHLISPAILAGVMEGQAWQSSANPTEEVDMPDEIRLV